MDYRVSLDIFDGPLDLLLHLIRRHELDVCDVALAGITDKYVRHVALLRELADRGEGGGVDLDTVGEFLVVAATLLEIKSNELLPRPEAGEASNVEAVDPSSLGDARLELVRQLLEYKRLRDSADRLEALREEHAQRFARVPASRPTDDEGELPPLALEELHVWDLLATFETLMGELGRRGPSRHEVTVDDTPIDLHAADIADRVSREGRVSFRALLLGRASRGEMIGVFLALLELVRQKRVLVTADDGDLQISDAPEAHKQTFEEESFTPPRPPETATMSSLLNENLDRLNLSLPPVPKPVASYLPAKKVGDLIYVSGQLPMQGGKMTVTGPVPSKTSVEDAAAACQQCVLNGLAAAASVGTPRGVVRVGVFVQSDAGFDGQPKVANGASDLLMALFGEDGRHARAAVGTNALPLDASVEVEFVFHE